MQLSPLVCQVTSLLRSLTMAAVMTSAIAGCGGGEDAGPGSGSGAPPAPPSMVTIALEGPKVVRLSWQDNSGSEQGFYIERQAGSGDFREVARTAANVTEYRDTTVNSGREYIYRVAALDSQNQRSEFAEEVLIDVP